MTGPPELFFPHSEGGGPGRWDPRSGSFSCGPLAEGDGMGLGRRGALVGIRLRWSCGLGVFLVEMGLFITTMSIPLSFPARSSEETTARSSGGEGAAAGGGGGAAAGGGVPAFLQSGNQRAWPLHLPGGGWEASRVLALSSGSSRPWKGT